MADARYDLFWALWDNYTWAQKEAFISNYRDQVAHELAEQIRTDAGEWDGWPEKQASMRYAADLIDPKAVNRG